MPKNVLPNKVYPRGDQGTFVYSPDIAVYVDTGQDQYGIIDLSPYITNFTIQRNVNAPSSFMCSFDNKFARFDRVVRRMNKIIVFLKRVSWVQVFSGYIDVAPWQTVVPGDAMLQASCTLKRLMFTYWDPHSVEAQALYPKADIAGATNADSGAAATMFKLLRVVANWPKEQIQIQRIPQVWLQQASEILQKTKDEQLNDPDYGVIQRALSKLLTDDEWLGYPLGNSGTTIGDALGTSNASGVSNSAYTTGGSLAPGSTAIDEEWYKLVGVKTLPLVPPGFGHKPDRFGGHISDSRLATVPLAPGVKLRPDAAQSLQALLDDTKTNKARGSVNFAAYNVHKSYVSYETERADLENKLKHNNNKASIVCATNSCPAGISPHSWGVAIDFDPGTGSPDSQTMEHYGWVSTDADNITNPNHWEFVGNYRQGYPAFIRQSDAPKHQGRGPHGTWINTKGQFDWDKFGNRDKNADSANNVFKTTYFWPGFEVESAILTGKRAWINDVPLIQSITDMTAASMRDFQSAPNGDFTAYFPDRLGIYGKFAAMQVRDIEIVDFKLIIQDRSLVTHYVSVADMTTPEPHTGIDLDVLINAGYVTVEQPEVMRLLLGLPKDETPVGLGEWIMQRFGIRPRRDDNYDIWNVGFNYMIALHRFQEAWASQWNALVNFTFLPEIYPGMRIELVNYNIGVYVEQVAHTGSRTAGFSTIATVSTPMRKVNGKWKILPMEFDPAQFKVSSAFTNEDEFVVLDSTEFNPISGVSNKPVF